MKYSLGIKPFKEYWLNCSYNAIFSLLTSVEPSYRLAAFQNDYSYKISEDRESIKTIFNFLALQPMIEFKNEMNVLFCSSQPINFKYDKNYCDLLKELIRNKELVQVGVDLFYWIPDSICWNKHHWSHYSLIDGFDDEKKVFYVLDENINGFDIHEIPEERFLIAIHSSPIEPHGYKNRLFDNIPPYKFSIENVINNAKRLRDGLRTIKFDPLWKLKDDDYNKGYMMDLFSMHLFQIMNRHIANRFLFQAVQKEVHGTVIPDSIEQYCQDLYNGWKTLRNILVKMYFSDGRDLIIIDINERCKNLFLKEFEMWDTFLYNITR